MNLPFDTQAGIEGYLDQGIAGLHLLVADRERHYQKTEQQLDDWYLFGSYWIDTFGQLWKIRVPQRGAPRVCKLEQLLEMQREDVGFSCSPGALPPAVDICSWCRRGWTFHNLHDVHAESRNDGWVIQHEECSKLARDARIGEQLLPVVDAFYAAVTASYSRHPPRQVPNLYPDQNGPWFLLGGDELAIVVGWRRRVIEISWDRGSLDLDGTKLFPDVKAEGITVGDRYVHAYGYEKATEYITRLARAIHERSPR